MTKTLISLGANLGNPRQVMHHAGEMIVSRYGESNVDFSRLYRTPAVGGPAGQGDFYNAVATIESAETAFEIWQSLSAIEQSLGRQRRNRWEARRIDLDVLLHESERIWTPTLKVPHPRMIMRTFVLEPACDVASNWIEPVTGQSINSLCQSLLQMRAKSLVGEESVHVLVLSESFLKLRQISEALIVESPDTAMDDRKSIAAIPTEANDRWTVHMNQRRRFTLHSIVHLTRPPSAIQFDDIRRELNQQIIEFQASSPLNLVVFAGASPDPSVIHWEDYCRSWAELLGLISTQPFTSNTEAFRRLPKYLLAAEDSKWAAHELHAAMTAMTCPTQPCGAFFDV